jgi:opacity protein-like surface antigen
MLSMQKQKTCFLLTLALAGLILVPAGAASAQDALLKMLDDSLNTNAGKTYVTGTFKATHVVNMQTVETPARGALNFVIQHRFGQLNSGAYNFFGLDNATLRLGLDYGVTDRLAAGIGRSSVDKAFDGYLKYKILRQTDGAGQMPVTVSGLADISHYTLKHPEKPYLNSTYRTAYLGQLLIARKFNRQFSAEIAPAWLHYNLVPTAEDKNDQFAVGAGGRMKITRRMSINVEYNYLLPDQSVSQKVYNSFSVGWDIETGGHVFQLVVTNSQGLIESQYIGQTTGSWGDGGIYFGFNISRNFNITRHSRHKTSF